jgi:hypothetical protein
MHIVYTEKTRKEHTILEGNPLLKQAFEGKEVSGGESTNIIASVRQT